MKLLLDEQLPRKLIEHFPPDITVQTVQRQGWAGIKNGELLRLAASYPSDALISADKNMEYQQSADELPISVVILYVLRLRTEDLAPLIPAAVDKLNMVSSPAFIRVGT